MALPLRRPARTAAGLSLQQLSAHYVAARRAQEAALVAIVLLSSFGQLLFPKLTKLTEER
eukprot:14643-Heterococcus_DN1.PRE.1